MIKLIVGTKGSGKTKAMIDMINDSVKTSKGNVVVVEKGMKLTYEVPNAARLIDLDEYKIAGGEMLYGFVAGLLARRSLRLCTKKRTCLLPVMAVKCMKLF